MEHSAVIAVGVWFYSVSTDRYLYLMRDDPKHPNSWGLPGGKAEPGESLMDAIVRECREEIGSFPPHLRLVPLEKFTSADGRFSYNTFFVAVDREFVPVLNAEHHGYAWLDSLVWPRPMHPGLWNMVNFDAVKLKIDTLRSGFQTSQ